MKQLWKRLYPNLNDKPLTKAAIENKLVNEVKDFSRDKDESPGCHQSVRHTSSQNCPQHVEASTQVSVPPPAPSPPRKEDFPKEPSVPVSTISNAHENSLNSPTPYNKPCDSIVENMDALSLNGPKIKQSISSSQVKLKSTISNKIPDASFLKNLKPEVIKPAKVSKPEAPAQQKQKVCSQHAINPKVVPPCNKHNHSKMMEQMRFPTDSQSLPSQSSSATHSATSSSRSHSGKKKKT